MPFHESTNEQAERVVSEHARSLQVLVMRSVTLREVRSGLGIIRDLVSGGRLEQALERIDKLISEIDP